MAIENKIHPGTRKPFEETRESLAPIALTEIPGPPGDAQGRDELLEHTANTLFLLLAKGSPQGLSLKEVFFALERKVLLKALCVFGGHQAKAADFLHVLTTTLNAKLKKHRISRKFLKTSTLNRLVFQGREGRQDSPDEWVKPALKSDIDAAIERSLNFKA